VAWALLDFSLGHKEHHLFHNAAFSVLVQVFMSDKLGCVTPSGKVYGPWRLPFKLPFLGLNVQVRLCRRKCLQIGLGFKAVDLSWRPGEGGTGERDTAQPQFTLRFTDPTRTAPGAAHGFEEGWS